MADRKNPAAKKAEGTQNEAEAPERQGDAEASSNGNSGNTGKAPAQYHLYTTDDDGSTLKWFTDLEAKTADAAVAEAVKADESLVGKTLVVVPERNLKTFKTEVKTTTRVKVSAA